MDQANFPIQALGEYLLVKLDPEETIIGNIALPDDAIEPVFTGTVVSVGPDVPPTLTVGCHVRWLFPLGSCFSMPDDGAQYARIHESDLVGVVVQTPVQAASKRVGKTHAAELLAKLAS